MSNPQIFGQELNGAGLAYIIIFPNIDNMNSDQSLTSHDMSFFYPTMNIKVKVT